MECHEAVSRLSTGLEGELGPTDARRLEQHLAGCASCRRDQARLVATLRAVQALPPETVSAEFDARLRRRLAAETAGPRRRSLRRRLPVLALGAAAVLVIVTLGVPRRRDAPRPPDAQVPVAWATRAPERPGFDCRVGSAGRCHVDAACATARSCGAVDVAGLLTEPLADSR